MNIKHRQLKLLKQRLVLLFLMLLPSLALAYEDSGGDVVSDVLNKVVSMLKMAGGVLLIGAIVWTGIQYFLGDHKITKGRILSVVVGGAIMIGATTIKSKLLGG